MPSGPRSISWTAAPGSILARAAALRASRPAVVIGITGPVGAGKSTLAAAISPCIIATDHYLPDYEKTPEHLRDDPNHADFTRLAQDLANLRAQRATHIPLWSFHTHKREGEQPITPHEIVVVEGIHALHEPLLSLLDIRVFVEAPREIRWDRWAHLERTGQRGWGVEKARDYFHRIAEVTFAQYEPLYRTRADVVVLNDSAPTIS